ncbi:F510_1955 family glycosylhydrolase [Bacillus sp. DJP31]|uniref:F510_1955 family glycosylhydrolase n=1 Tax=Bacillus sp. DJP31 TaxID=3409789 RepID=UPI003BB801A0
MKYFVSLFSFILLLTGCTNISSLNNNVNESAKESAETPEPTATKASGSTDYANHEFYQPLKGNLITHIHGIGYPTNQEALFLATHHGLKIFSNGKWFETIANNHDYMGFQATALGFYSSGHPEVGSDLSNPLGLLKSEDLGQTLKQLNFMGESDLHFMSASYFTEKIYVLNEQPNSQIGSGLFYSDDSGVTWTNSKLGGLPQTSAHTFSVHPKLDKIIGISTPEGLFLSHDRGNSFSLVSDATPVTSQFIKDDAILYVIEMNGQLKLLEQSLESDDAQTINLPPIDEDDEFIFIAVNPLDEGKMSISTMNGSVWTTSNHGESWTILLDEGKILKQ